MVVFKKIQFWWSILLFEHTTVNTLHNNLQSERHFLKAILSQNFVWYVTTFEWETDKCDNIAFVTFKVKKLLATFGRTGSVRVLKQFLLDRVFRVIRLRVFNKFYCLFEFDMNVSGHFFSFTNYQNARYSIIHIYIVTFWKYCLYSFYFE